MTEDAKTFLDGLFGAAPVQGDEVEDAHLDVASSPSSSSPITRAEVDLDRLPHYPDDFAREVRELMALEFGGSPGDYRVWRPRDIAELVPNDLREAWEERSAIMEHDGKLSRDKAERLALRDVLFQSKGWKRR